MLDNTGIASPVGCSADVHMGHAPVVIRMVIYSVIIGKGSPFIRSVSISRILGHP